jgi:hypothetical protein
MKITQSSLPENSQTRNFLPAGYVETYSVIVPENSLLTPDNLRYQKNCKLFDSGVGSV